MAADSQAEPRTRRGPRVGLREDEICRASLSYRHRSPPQGSRSPSAGHLEHDLALGRELDRVAEQVFKPVSGPAVDTRAAARLRDRHAQASACGARLRDDVTQS